MLIEVRRSFPYAIAFVWVVLGVNLFGQELIPFSVNGKYGYIDKGFNTVVSPKFEKVEPFYDSDFAAACESDNKWIILDKEGKEYLKIEARFVQHIYDDAFSVDTDKGFYIIRVGTRKIIRDKLSYIFGSTDGIIAVAFMDESPFVGYIDMSGKRLIPEARLRKPSYKFSNGLAIVTLDNWEKVIINKNGEVIGSKIISHIGQQYSEGLIPAKTKDEITGYLNTKGEFEFKIPIVANDFIQATDFINGFALVMTNEKASVWRVINSKGKYVSKEIKIDSATGFVNRVSLVGKIDNKKKVIKWGYLKTNGEFLIEPILDKADVFHNGYAMIVMNGRDGLVDVDGNIYWSDEIVKGKYKTSK